MSTLRKTARRVNRSRLSEYVGDTVRFVGRVKEVDGSLLSLEAPDGGDVSCHITSEAPESKYVEVTAVVQPDCSLQQVDFLIELGNNLNLQLVNDAINLTFHPQIRATQEAAE
eukprot:GHVN01021843.1.p1 GENE.GHVN01021843.1~~GHVN01021843.1.p1  ORF type:complete len:113 (+),score=27.96 GHVN01021843.1:64-402(+)